MIPIFVSQYQYLNQLTVGTMHSLNLPKVLATALFQGIEMKFVPERKSSEL